MNAQLHSLSDKEKQTLRLLLRGYDAKSIAREFDLSIHTVNERLRDARRKLAVSSSREAARCLAEAEAVTPELLGDKRLGNAARTVSLARERSSQPVPGWRRTRTWAIGGMALMSLALALYALASLTDPVPAGSAATSETANETAALDSARAWLAKVDAADWQGSYADTAAYFRKVNTQQLWADSSVKVRGPLGAVKSRVLAGNEWVPAPPNGYRMVKFRTQFAGKPNAVETLALVSEGGGWKVTGYTID